jgi:hypothetical protein
MAATSERLTDVIEVGTEADNEGEYEPLDYDAESSASTSITSSIYRHSFENGRR